MKKILGIILLALVGIGFFITQRVSENPITITPYPYTVSPELKEKVVVEAPIVIIGDRLGQRLASFKDKLSEALSINLSKPIKVISLAQEGMNIHRIYTKIKQLNRVPLIVIYLGGSEEVKEKLFYGEEYSKINENFKKYNDDTLKTLIMIFPSFSRFIYTPHKRISLGRVPIPFQIEKLEDDQIQKYLILNYKLFESAFTEFTSYIKKANSLFIPITPPLNLTTPPKKSCYGTLTGDSGKDYENLIKVYNNKDYKQALNLSKDLVLLNPHNADINFMHSMILKKQQNHKSAQVFAEDALIYDCHRTDGNTIYNTIIKRVAKAQQIQYIDFHQMLYDFSENQPVFLDETYPQDVYFMNIINKLSKVIKKRLRL